jgi:hypothetical protein
VLQMQDTLRNVDKGTVTRFKRIRVERQLDVYLASEFFFWFTVYRQG